MTTKVEESVRVDVPVTTAYNQWTQFEDFPYFMGGVTEVRQLDDRRLPPGSRQRPPAPRRWRRP
jgi:uncharacterized membrane protein